MKNKTHQLTLDVQFASAALAEKWDGQITKPKLKKWVQAALLEDATITIRFVGRSEGRKLNAAYRQKDYATNVLTFPYEEQPGIDHLYADIIICPPVVEKEAKEQQKTFLQHLAHLTIHGTLHAQGFDHEDEIEAQAMEELEVAILKKLKQPNPYE
jgi:probable rRNA maturation factor